MPPRRVERRVSYLTRRFAPHAPRWQLVIWARQLTLLAMVTASKLATASPPAVRYQVRYLTAFGALVLLLAFWRWHTRHQPYALRMQNSLESWLYASNVLLLLAVSRKQQKPQELAELGAWPPTTTA